MNALARRCARVVLGVTLSVAPLGLHAQDIRLGTATPIALGPLHEYPALASAADGTLWLAYMSLDGADEVISLRTFRDGVFGKPIELARGAMAYRPQLVVGTDGTVWVAWTGVVQGRAQLFVRSVRDGQPGAVVRVSSDGEAWAPAAAIDARGQLWLAWEQRQDSSWRVMAAVLSQGDVIRTPFAVHASATGNQMRPALAAARNGVWLAWDEYAGGYDYDVLIRRIDRDEAAVRLTGAPTLEQAPALAPAADGGVWVAWHSNRGDDGQPGIPRWVELRHWNGKQLREPVAPMVGKNLAAVESMQSFEFPSLVSDAAGRVWLFGRPSQSFYAQVFAGDRWSQVTPFGEEGWGGRGLAVAAVATRDGIWTARRDVGRILLQKLEWNGGAVASPRLQAAAGRGVVARVASSASSATQKAAGGREVASPGLNLYFGDIHQHSSLSDGMGTVEDAYTRSRDRYRFDFGVLTDHEWFVQNRLLPSEWAYIKAVTSSFNRPGAFVSIPAYEWTGRRYPLSAGHKNVYFLQDDAPLFSIEDPRYDTTPELFAAGRSAGALAFPHHIGWTGTDWENFDPLVEPDVEIVSVHGAFEYMGNEPIGHRGGMPGMFVQDGLARGLRFGILGSTDGHGLLWQHGVGRKADPWQHGLTGVWAPELTREAIFDALRKRTVYATSGARIQLWFGAEGKTAGSATTVSAPMGGEVAVTGAPTLRSQVVGTGKIRYVQLVRDNKVIYSFGGDADGGRYGNFTFTDLAATPGTHWYYLRVVQYDDEMAWSSPIWIEVIPQ